MTPMAFFNTAVMISTLLYNTGSPLSVLHHLGLGVWSFLASPAQGLKESTQGGGLNLPRLIDGFVEGSRSLASNVALAVSTATSKTTETARRGLISLGLDKLEATGGVHNGFTMLGMKPLCSQANVVEMLYSVDRVLLLISCHTSFGIVAPDGACSGRCP